MPIKLALSGGLASLQKTKLGPEPRFTKKKTSNFNWVFLLLRDLKSGKMPFFLKVATLFYF